MTLRQGTREPEILQHFIRVLNMQQNVHALQEARAGIELCFDITGIDLQQLSRPATEILKGDPLFAEMMSLVQQGAMQELQACLLADRFANLLQDRLFILALTWTLICDPDFELLLGSLRRIFLDISGNREAASTQAGIVDDDGTLLAALACQCFSNEYCYTVGAKELIRLEMLEQMLAADLAAGRGDVQHDPARLCVYGMYRPLYRLPGVERLFADEDQLGAIHSGSSWIFSGMGRSRNSGSAPVYRKSRPSMIRRRA